MGATSAGEAQAGALCWELALLWTDPFPVHYREVCIGHYHPEQINTDFKGQSQGDWDSTSVILIPNHKISPTKGILGPVFKGISEPKDANRDLQNLSKADLLMQPWHFCLYMYVYVLCMYICIPEAMACTVPASGSFSPCQ